MYLLIRYAAGVVVEGVVLANGKNRMRVAAAGFPDTLELKRSGGQWTVANRQSVEVDFMMSQPSDTPNSGLKAKTLAHAN
ncbi:MAG TPA: hypothetical protein VHW09_20230 [Bryobacteraceae bacterium]|jgi:hypothetical protein|nr:hypothetical protein [Bryobacteraceae bacterium]